jgi:putative transposase
MELIRTRDPVVPFKAACELLGVPLSTARRQLAPKKYGPRRPRPSSHRKLTQLEQHISKLATYMPDVFLNLYLVLDLFSRYPVSWMVGEHTNSALAK